MAATDPMSQMMGQINQAQSRKLRLECKGLILAPSELMRAPGGLIVADNVNIEAPGIIRSRQGFAKQTYAPGGPILSALSTKQLGTDLLVNHDFGGGGLVASALAYGDGSAAWTAINDSSGSRSTVGNTPDQRMRGIVCQKNHYLTSSFGVRRLETNKVLFGAGMPKSIGFDLTGLSTGATLTTLVGGSGGFLADGGACAYRVTWCKKDQEGIVMEGAPSSKVVVYNKIGTTGYSGGNAQNVTCRIRLPKENNGSYYGLFLQALPQ